MSSRHLLLAVFCIFELTRIPVVGAADNEPRLSPRLLCEDPQRLAQAPNWQPRDHQSCQFTGLTETALKKYLAFYPGHGMGLQTVSFHLRDGVLLATGAFDSSVKDPVEPSILLTETELSEETQKLTRSGYRPRQVSVIVDREDTARFTLLWQKQERDVAVVLSNLTDAEFEAKWEELVVRQKYWVEDYSEYMVNGQHRHVAIFVFDGSTSVYFYNRMSRAELQDTLNSLHLKGFHITSLNACLDPEKTSFAAVWKPSRSGWVAYADMSAATFAQRSKDLERQSYHLHKIQVYGNSDRFGGVWRSIP